MLRNHGLLTVAPTIPDAFQLMYIFEAACTIQVRAQAGGELIPIPQSIIDNAQRSRGRSPVARAGNCRGQRAASPSAPHGLDSTARLGGKLSERSIRLP